MALNQINSQPDLFLLSLVKEIHLNVFKFHFYFMDDVRHR